MRLAGDAGGHVRLANEFRREASQRGGSAIVLSLPGRDPLTGIDRWGSIGDAQPLMRAVKARFDPHHILNASVSPWD